MTLLSVLISVLLLVFTLRRYVFLLGSLLPGRPLPPSHSKSIAVLVSARNEAVLLPRLLRALDELTYPAPLLQFVLISDGSTDSTPTLLQSWTARRPNATTLHRTTCEGKASALRAAIELVPDAELFAVLDADTVPAPDVLQHLAAAFSDLQTGAAGGYPEPGNSSASLTARYAAIERWTLHLVTLAGKDRLHLNPAAIGAVCMIRRKALEEIGGFPVGATAEDIHISVLLNRAGWRTRSVLAAVAREDVPESLPAFREQRVRWSRGLLETRRTSSGVEDFLVSLGYLDRLVLLAAFALAGAGVLSPWLVGLYLAPPLLSVLLALWRANAQQKWLYLATLPAMVIADIVVTVISVLAHCGSGPIRWVTRVSPAKPVRE